MPGTFSPPPLVNDHDMHHGTGVKHVPWCMPGSLTNGFPWSQWRGKRSRHFWRMHMRNSQFYGSGKDNIGKLGGCLDRIETFRGEYKPSLDFCVLTNFVVRTKATSGNNYTSHYLNQWWNIVDWTLRNKLQWNCIRNSYIFIQENAFETAVCEMAAILSRPQWVKTGKCAFQYFIIYCNAHTILAMFSNDFTPNMYFNSLYLHGMYIVLEILGHSKLRGYVWERISNYFPHFIMDVILIHLSWTMLVKGGSERNHVDHGKPYVLSLWICHCTLYISCDSLSAYALNKWLDRIRN